ncbi:PhzF family phenazine biosynthesis protein [Actinomadura roseirufa]|uniref:PhzF family phenazine biosynthesis protein n=1 Tax=Actinomadura roseirufa TaxID=2094049 RepID=UPI0010415F72|nr:PhzF family phenazine biosynthesis protein [Actinomadura roseirufa]
MSAPTHQAEAVLEVAARYHHVDVFTDVAYAGNSLTVFVDPPHLSTAQMSKITKELRHFETIFLTSAAVRGTVEARVFDLHEELDFAGHPVLGAAAVLHRRSGVPPEEEREWTFVLAARTVQVTTRGDAAGHVSALLDQGRPELIHRASPSDRPAIAAALGLAEGDLDPALLPEVISTGLKYLIVPVSGQDALARARITRPDFDAFLAGFGAQFAYVLDPAGIEGRHWNNDGLLEDIATGSAAGCVAAYLLRQGLAAGGERVHLSQGRFVGRPSTITVTAYGTPDAVVRVTVGGDIAVVGTGSLHVLPPLEPQ